MHAFKYLLGFWILNCSLQVLAHSDVDYAVDFVKRYFDEQDLNGRYLNDLDERDLDFELEFEVREFDDDNGLFARDFNDDDGLWARDFDERDFDDEEDLFARDFFDIEERSVPVLQELFDGNQQFKSSQHNQQLIKTSSTGKHIPAAMFLGCADSRVSEGTVFNAKPGTMFSHRNLANQFNKADQNGNAVLSYAVGLGVQHVIVMGHYGCGAIRAAMMPPPAAGSHKIETSDPSVQAWIKPIRDILRTSNRTEIVALRDRLQKQPKVEVQPNDPGYRALTEENVKATVRNVVQSAAIQGKHQTQSLNLNYGSSTDVFVHGLVYDITTGEIKDLGVSVGPHGKAIPAMPFAKLGARP